MEHDTAIYISFDVRPDQFGNIMGELIRTGWTVTGADELDEERRPFAPDAQPREVKWQRMYAKRQLGDQPLHLGP